MDVIAYLHEYLALGIAKKDSERLRLETQASTVLQGRKTHVIYRDSSTMFKKM